MLRWYNDIRRVLQQYEDDLEYLLFVGVPGGILMILFYDHLDFTNLF